MFIFDAILESIICGNTQIPTATLHLALKQLSSVDPETGKTGFQQQFDVSFHLQMALPVSVHLLFTCLGVDPSDTQPR